MRRRVLVDANHVDASHGELAKHRGPHRAEPYDCYVRSMRHAHSDPVVAAAKRKQIRVNNDL
jgi:hypothetical protein